MMAWKTVNGMNLQNCGASAAGILVAERSEWH